MQTKSISKLIQSKVNEWIETINDTELRHELKKCTLVSGGSITSLYLGAEVNDYDIYLTDRSVLLKLTAYYIKPFPGDIRLLDGTKRQEYIDQYSAGFSDEDFLNKPGHEASVLRNLKEDQVKLYMYAKGGGFKVPQKAVDKDGKDLKYQAAYFSPNAISLTDDLQIVIRFWGTPDEIHKTFDFIHATNYWTHEKGVVLNLPAVESLLTKQLKYQGSQYPVTSIIRTKKFTKRGFNITAGEMLKMIFQVSRLDLTDMDVLEEQLIGVDVAYFEALITAIREHKENNPDFTLTAEWLGSLIDKIFNNHIEED